MDTVTISVVTESQMRASEVMSDLRIVSETLYYPMQLVGFEDHRQGLHLCPQLERRQTCPHALPSTDPDFLDYELQLQRERKANVRLDFPHAGISIYLG